MSTTPVRPDIPAYASDANYSALGDAYDAGLVKRTPTTGQITQGARPRRQLPAQFFNWLNNRWSNLLQWFADRADEGFPHAIRVGTSAEMEAVEDAVAGDVWLVPVVNGDSTLPAHGRIYVWESTRTIYDSPGPHEPFEYTSASSIDFGEPPVGKEGAWVLVRGATDEVANQWQSGSGNSVTASGAYLNVALVSGNLSVTLPHVYEGDIIEVCASLGLTGNRTAFLRAVYADTTDHPVPGTTITVPTQNPSGGYAHMLGRYVATQDRINATVRVQVAVDTGSGSGNLTIQDDCVVQARVVRP